MISRAPHRSRSQPFGGDTPDTASLTRVWKHIEARLNSSDPVVACATCKKLGDDVIPACVSPSSVSMAQTTMRTVHDLGEGFRSTSRV